MAANDPRRLSTSAAPGVAGTVVIRVPEARHLLSLSAGATPVARVRPGDTVVLETADCFAGQIHEPDQAPASVDWDRINPATGPVYVEGAAPGDVLVVRIDRIEVTSPGVMAVSPGFGVLRDRIEETRFEVIPMSDGSARLPIGVEIPLRPMIGVIGVAPPGDPVPCGSPGPHGGNMDTRLIGEGAAVYLPVFAPGALLAAGDLHAAMGDGEICGTGIEVAGAIWLRVDLRRDLTLAGPVVETRDVIATVASAVTLDDAADQATCDMADVLMRALGVSAVEVTQLMSVAGQLQVSQVVDPLKTARFALPREVVAQFGRALL